MTMMCSACGKPVQSYHQFCPWCDLELPSPQDQFEYNSASKTNSSDSPISKHAISLPSEMDAVSITEQEKSVAPLNFAHDLPTVPPTGTSPTLHWQRCHQCQEEIPIGNQFCLHCGINLLAMTDVPHATSESCVTMENNDPTPSITPFDHSLTLPWLQLNDNKEDGAPPLRLCIKRGVPFRANTVDVLEFLIVNQCSAILGDTEITVNSRWMNPQGSATLGRHLLPNGSITLHVPGFTPQQAGRDVVKIAVKGWIRGGEEIFLDGSTTLEVLQDASHPFGSPFHLNFHGPTLVDNLEKIQREVMQATQRPNVQSIGWEEIPLYWNRERMQRGLSFQLELCNTKEQFLVRNGWRIGQSYPDSQAEILLHGQITGIVHVHRKHAQFQWIDGRWYVTPLDQKSMGGSFTNPTFINSMKLQIGKAHPLKNGDRLTVSGVSFFVRFN